MNDNFNNGNSVGDRKPVMSGLENYADRLVDKKMALKRAKDDYVECEGRVIGKTLGEYIERAEVGDFSKSIVVAGKRTAGVTVIWSDAFSPLPVHAESNIRQLDSKFDDHFERHYKIRVKNASAERVKELTDRFGTEFGDLFEVDVELRAKEGMDRMQFEELPEDVRHMRKQRKPSVKVR